jgi:hypothetical protein
VNRGGADDVHRCAVLVAHRREEVVPPRLLHAPGYECLNTTGYEAQSTAQGGVAVFLIRKHDHFTPARKMRRDVRALTARNHPRGRQVQNMDLTVSCVPSSLESVI